MTVDDVKRIIDFAIAKNNGQGYNSPDEFNNYMRFAESGYLDYLRGEYQRYQIRRPIAVVEFSQNQAIRTSLAPLIYGAILNIDSSGVAPFPSDYEFTDAMWSLYGIYNIKFVQQDRLSSNYRSVIDPVISNPVYLINHDGFQFYPENLGNAKMSYVRTPPFMRWGYTEDANGLPVYNAALSSQPVWSDTDLMQVIVRALQMCGVNLQAAMVYQYAEQVKQTGQ